MYGLVFASSFATYPCISSYINKVGQKQHIICVFFQEYYIFVAQLEHQFNQVIFMGVKGRAIISVFLAIMQTSLGGGSFEHSVLVTLCACELNITFCFICRENCLCKNSGSLFSHVWGVWKFSRPSLKRLKRLE